VKLQGNGICGYTESIAGEGVGRQRIFWLGSLYWLVSRAATFSFVMAMLMFALYLLGSFQEFLDSSQVLLLALLRITLLAEILLSALYILVALLLGRPQRRLGRLLLSFLSAGFCTSLLLVLGFLTAWFQL
jgi:hypothetical protein